MMDTEFSPTPGDAGSALQQAWMGACLVGVAPGSSTRLHSTIGSCTAGVRRALYAAGRALKLAELRAATGHESPTIGSVLVKLQALGDVRKVPAPTGRNRNATYLWIGTVEPEMRKARVKSSQ